MDKDEIIENQSQLIQRLKHKLNYLELNYDILKKQNKILFKHFFDESETYVLTIKTPLKFIKVMEELEKKGYCLEIKPHGIFNWVKTLGSLKYFADKVNKQSILDTNIWKFFQHFFLHNMLVIDKDNLRTTKTLGKDGWKVAEKHRIIIDEITSIL